MALRGSLHEFELSEIFQLISRDGKTGQLVLSNDNEEAFVVFSQGFIVAAGNNTQNLQTLLFNYLSKVKRYSSEELNELLYLCQGEMRIFSQELIKRNYILQEDLVALVRLGIEDLACNLFLWEDGQYRFDTIEAMDEYVIAGIKFPTDAITMEAMRRNDEWKRIRQKISMEAVFALSPTSQHKKQWTPQSSALYDPVGYIASQIDGTSTVGTLCEKSFFFEYRIFEILFGLLNDGELIPLSVKQAPPPEQEKNATFSKPKFITATTTAIAACIWLALLAIFFVVIHSIVFKQKVVDKVHFSNQVLAVQASQKYRIAILQFRAENGMALSSKANLYTKGYLTKKDITENQQTSGDSSNQK